MKIKYYFLLFFIIIINYLIIEIRSIKWNLPIFLKNNIKKINSVDYQIYWFNQTLDHFNWNSNPQFYQQRYLVNGKVKIY